MLPAKIYADFIPTLYVYWMSLNGGFEIGCSSSHTFLIVAGMFWLPQVIFSLGITAFSVGFRKTIKLILRYPAVISIQAMAGTVYAPKDYESICKISFGSDNISVHPTCFINILLSNIMRMAILLMPKNNEAIITQSYDGTNVAFGLQISAMEMTIITIVSQCLAQCLFVSVTFFWDSRLL